MKKASLKQSRAASNGPAGLGNGPAGLGSAAVSITTAGQAYMNAIGEYQAELSDFVARRLAGDIAHGQSLATCADIGAVAAQQQEWARRAIDDYVDEGRKLFRIASTAFASPTRGGGK